MEFNELLHRQLNLRENMLKRLQNELVDLRGPVSMLNVVDQVRTVPVSHIPSPIILYLMTLMCHGSVVEHWNLALKVRIPSVAKFLAIFTFMYAMIQVRAQEEVIEGDASMMHLVSCKNLCQN